MKKLRDNKTLIFSWIISIVIIIVSMIILSSKDIVIYSKNLLLNSIIHSFAVVTLVFVTWFYAKQTEIIAKQGREQSIQSKEIALQTQKLVEEQKLSRDLEFSERRLHEFYNPFIYSLDQAIKKFIERRIEETDEFLKKPQEDIFYRYSYMISKDTLGLVDGLLIEIAIKGIDEHNNDLEDVNNEKKILFGRLKGTRNRLHDERTKIEDYISNNYPFQEKKIKR